MLRFFSVVAVATVLFASYASAETALDLSGPAELPPASFKGQQYIDSRGCAFLRAGYGGQVAWVPRVTRDRRQICGNARSGGKVDVTEAPAKAAPVVVVAAPKPTSVPAPAAKPARAVGAPLDTVASLTTPPKIREAAPKSTVKSARVPRASYTPDRVVAAPAPPAGRPQIGTAAVAAPLATGQRLFCPAATPVAQRFSVQGGGTKLLCVKGNGSMTGANFPRLADGTKVTVIEGPAQSSSKSATLPPMPKGYVYAWNDDRLNIHRGKGTAAGDIAQDKIWTRTVPAELLEEGKLKRQPIIILVRPSSKGAARPDSKSVVQASGGFVQVGTFGEPANADKAASRLESLGLPVSRSKVKHDGRVMQIVYAGPFGSKDEAKAALRSARGAGFGDAILR